MLWVLVRTPGNTVPKLLILTLLHLRVHPELCKCVLHKNKQLAFVHHAEHFKQILELEYCTFSFPTRKKKIWKKKKHKKMVMGFLDHHNFLFNMKGYSTKEDYMHFFCMFCFSYVSNSLGTDSKEFWQMILLKTIKNHIRR